MAKKASSIFLVLFMLTYMWFPALSIFADGAQAGTFGTLTAAAASSGVTSDGSQNGDFVSDFGELQEWLEVNYNSGKTATFSDDIIIPSDKSMSIGGVTLKLMEYGLIIESNDVRLMDGAKIIGEAENKPVVTVLSGGSFFIPHGQAEIESTGANSTAVKIEGGGSFDVNAGAWCEISSKGKDSIGIDSVDELELSNTFIRSGGTGIISGGDVELFLCDINAPVPVEKTAGDVLLDTCLVNPPVADATIINRKITGIDEDSQENLYHMSILGRDISTNLFDSSLYVFLSDSNAPLEEDRGQYIPVSWDMSAIDTGKEGVYEIIGTIPPPFDRFKLDSEFPLKATLEVVDASLPVFYKIFAMTGRYTLYTVYFLYEADDLSGLTLERSDDEGASWDDYTEAFTQNWDGSWILTFRDPLDYPVLLVFTVDGLGESKILSITWDDYEVSAVRGGDRYAGRGENSLPEDEPSTATPPDSITPSEPDKTTTNRPSSTSNRSYEPAETTKESDAPPPVGESDAPEPDGESEAAGILYDSAPSAPANGTGQPPSPQAPDEPAGDIPEAEDTSVPDTAPKTQDAVQTIAAAPIEESGGNTENTQRRRSFSDSVIPVVFVGSLGLAGAGTYLGFAGKLPIKTLLKLLMGRL